MNDVKNYPQINLRIAPEIKEWVQAQAKAEDRSVNYWLSRLIEKAKNETPQAR